MTRGAKRCSIIFRIRTAIFLRNNMMDFNTERFAETASVVGFLPNLYLKVFAKSHLVSFTQYITTVYMVSR